MSKKEEQEKVGIKEISVNELVEDSLVFESKGISRVKVTRDGEVHALLFPIRSTGVSELVDTYSKKAPMPPVINEVVMPDSPIGKQLGLPRKMHVKTFDLTDRTYLERKEKHDQNLGIAILLQGLDMVIKDKGGNVVENSDKKIEILRGMKMSGDQFMQIVRDIESLTKWDEEREADFFVGS